LICEFDDLAGSNHAFPSVFFFVNAVFNLAMSFLSKRMVTGLSRGDIAWANFSFFSLSSSSLILAVRSVSAISFMLFAKSFLLDILFDLKI
ncbi:MAG TPA: hypothetical protein VHC50_10530, partial [Puia sp.]|nr:hypothetical protein [Puia sp.]